MTYFLRDSEYDGGPVKSFDSPAEVFWDFITEDELLRVDVDHSGNEVQVFHFPEWDESLEVWIPTKYLPRAEQPPMLQKVYANVAIETLTGERYRVVEVER